jgi:uncharacterized membrane protein YdbT with pleckstrin-like domain
MHLSAQPDISAGIDWQGHPWMTPSLVWLSIEAIALAVVLAWGELLGHLAFRHIGSVPVLYATLAIIFLIWLVGSMRLAIIRATHKYTLRGSSLEIQQGLLSKRIFTVSAAGFSDLEVIKSITGRILNMGNIMVETDSHRDLRLINIRDPVKVAALIRQVMTVPTVRIAPPTEQPRDPPKE